MSALRSAELEHAVGSLSAEDYRWLRRQCLRDAAAAMRACSSSLSKKRRCWRAWRRRGGGAGKGG